MLWTPTVLVLDAQGVERWRMEGYLPRDEFSAGLEMARARLAFVEKRWQAAEEIYNGVARNAAATVAAPEAIYWAAVCYYKRTQDHTGLHPMSERLMRDYPDSLAAKRAIPFR